MVTLEPVSQISSRPQQLQRMAIARNVDFRNPIKYNRININPRGNNIIIEITTCKNTSIVLIIMPIIRYNPKKDNLVIFIRF